jgi:GTP-binding protein
VHSFEVINGELAAFSESLTQKPMIVVATKLDATTDRARLDALRAYCKKHNLEFHSISAVAGEGVKELVRSIADALDKIPRAALEADDGVSDAIKVDPSARHAGQDGDS